MPRSESSRTFKRCKQRSRLGRLSYRDNIRQIFLRERTPLHHRAFHHITEPFDSVACSGLDWHSQPHLIQFKMSFQKPEKDFGEGPVRCNTTQPRVASRIDC